MLEEFRFGALSEILQEKEVMGEMRFNGCVDISRVWLPFRASSALVFTRE